MKKLFGHLLPLTEAEIEAIWNDGTLTVDANVLLDLYRYHGETRDALVQAFRAFHGRLWLSHQAASEFVRNRARGASAVGKELADAESDLKSIEAVTKKATDDLRSRRPLPREVGTKLKADIEAAIRTAKSSIEAVRTLHADGSSTDAVLNDVLSLFDGCVGIAPTDAELVDLHKEAERRIKERVPPGYEDAKKDGEGSRGDYLVWHQVLQRAKNSAKPVILVTSERKEDWWERAHGKTVGPRHELLDEAHRVAAQRVLIYQTESFLEWASKRAGGTFSVLIRNDIRAPHDDQELEDIVANVVEDLGTELIDIDSPVNKLIAQTNASGWRVDWVEVTDVGLLNYGSCTVPFEARVYYTGDQDEDHVWFGTKIVAEICGTIGFANDEWVVTDHEIVSADIEDVDDGPDDADDGSETGR